MFLRTLSIERVDAAGHASPCPLRWIDSFSMRSFTNDARFDDTLPVSDGRMSAGSLVPLPALQTAMEDWFRRKGYLQASERLVISESTPTPPATAHPRN